MKAPNEKPIEILFNRHASQSFNLKEDVIRSVLKNAEGFGVRDLPDILNDRIRIE